MRERGEKMSTWQGVHEKNLRLDQLNIFLLTFIEGKREKLIIYNTESGKKMIIHDPRKKKLMLPLAEYVMEHGWINGEKRIWRALMTPSEITCSMNLDSRLHDHWRVVKLFNEISEFLTFS